MSPSQRAQIWMDHNAEKILPPKRSFLDGQFLQSIETAFCEGFSQGQAELRAADGDYSGKLKSMKIEGGDMVIRMDISDAPHVDTVTMQLSEYNSWVAKVLRLQEENDRLRKREIIKRYSPLNEEEIMSHTPVQAK